MVLSIDDLRVDSYATQLSELELTELKGGVTPAGAAWLTYIGVSAAITGVGVVIGAIITSNSNANNDHKECDYQTTTTVTHNQDGSITTVSAVHHICNEKRD